MLRKLKEKKYRKFLWLLMLSLIFFATANSLLKFQKNLATWELETSNSSENLYEALQTDEMLITSWYDLIVRHDQLARSDPPLESFEAQKHRLWNEITNIRVFKPEYTSDNTDQWKGRSISKVRQIEIEISKFEVLAGIKATLDFENRKDTFLESLAERYLGFQVPETAILKTPIQVSLSINGKEEANGSKVSELEKENSLASSFQPGIPINLRKVRVSKRLIVELSGAAFDINRDGTAEAQIVSPIEYTSWKWKVTPNQTGDHFLTFNIYAVNEDGVTVVKSFSESVHVKVSRISWASAVFNGANSMVTFLAGVATIGSLVLGWIMFRKPMLEKEENQVSDNVQGNLKTLEMSSLKSVIEGKTTNTSVSQTPD